MISGLPEINQPCNPNPSQAFLLCSHDIHYKAQLTSNTDNKVKKLVMFFAKASLPSRQETVKWINLAPPISAPLDTGALPAGAINKIIISGHDPAFNQHCTAILIKLNNNCTWTAKNLPYPPSPAQNHFLI